MHLGNGAINPECAVLGFGLGIAGVVGARFLRGTTSRISATEGAAWAGFVFAAQMINVPIFASSSAHLVGGVLLAELLGPAVGIWTMTAILALQALLLGDGGLAALGWNVVDMAILPAMFLVGAKKLTSQRSLAIGIASFGSIVAAAALIPLVVAMGKPADQLVGWNQFASTMVGTHLLVALLEAAMTVAICLAPVRATAQQRAAVIATSAVLLAGFAWGLSSPLPDGYEAAAEQAGLATVLSDDPTVISRLGRLNGASDVVQRASVGTINALFPSEAAIAVIGTLAVAGVAAGFVGRREEAIASSPA